MELSELESLGVELNSELGVVMGSSRQGSHLDGDLVCLTGEGQNRQWSEAMMDRMRLDGQAVVDSDGDGLSDCEEAYCESDPNNSDTDNDGTLDEQEVQEGTDPTQDDSAQGNVELRGGGGVTGCMIATSGESANEPVVYLLALGLFLTRRKKF
ncbi:MAG: hypothetical protein IPJ88_03575 [Myxococcales bacterium]|nr:MAG: hypothetical protein IPJ88_03575 [Myxococcales bacterium]